MVLNVQNLAIRRGARLLQDALSLELAYGEALWVRGPNGVGKSTLLEALCGFQKPLSGVISWQGEAITNQIDHYHESLAYIGHKNGNNDALTCEAALRFYANLYGSDRFDFALRKMGLQNRAEIEVRYLSAGQQKRLALARLLLREAPIWILDEPSVSLDHDGVALLVEIISDHLSRKGMVVFTSHTKLAIKAKELQLKPLISAQISKSDPFLSDEWEHLQ